MGLLPILLAAFPLCGAAVRVEYGSISEESAERSIASVERGSLQCLCKKVDDVSECPDKKDDWGAAEKPSNPRYFHEKGSWKENHRIIEASLCCKAEKSVTVPFKNQDYQKQPDFSKCTVDERSMPEGACCRKSVGKGREKMGLHLSKVRAFNNSWPDYDGKTQYSKTSYKYALEDIIGATDYNGDEIDPEAVRSFVGQLLADKKLSELDCGTAWSVVSKVDTEQNCVLRERTSEQCCCREGILREVEVERCLEVPEAHTGESANTQIVNSIIHEWWQAQWGDLTSSVITDGPSPGLTEHLPKELSGFPDPVLQDDSLKFGWTRVGKQWASKCVEHKDLPYVVGSRQEGYKQEYRSTCIKHQWTKLCPAGHGKYKKKAAWGECLQERSTKPTLQRLGPLLQFECPEGYKSGTDGAEKFDEGCKCEKECSTSIR